MRNFKVGDYVIISNPKKDNVSFELNQLAIEHEGKLGRIFKIKKILDMQVCSIKLEDETLTAYGQFEIRFAKANEIREIDIRDVLPRVRGFEIVKDECRVHPDACIYLPRRGTNRSAGYDICTPVRIVVPPNGTSDVINTDIKAYMMEDEVLELVPRSSIGFKKGLMLVNTVGVIDSDFYGNPSNDGNIGFKFKNLTDKEVVIEAGERVLQGIFKKYLIIDDDNPIHSERVGGTGSTGR